MTEYLVKLRYYPGDALEEIKGRHLKSIAQKYGVRISYEKIENRQMKAGLLMEKTLDKMIEVLMKAGYVVERMTQEEAISRSLVK